MMQPKWLWLVVLLLLEGCRWCTTDACWEHERVALLQLKPSFNDFNYLNSWVEVEGSDCCEWERVECNTITRRVIGLSLNYTRGIDRYLGLKKYWYLNASLFFPFEELKSLYLLGNAIIGFVENEGFTKLSSTMGNLEILDLSYNYLNDSILLSLSELSSLKYLNLAGNLFKGSSHPNGFAKLSSALRNLEILDLTHNYLNDNIILFLSEISSLKYLNLAENLFTGSSHPNGFQWLSRLRNLETLDLSSNFLKNRILFHIGSISSLKTLILRSNNLERRVHIHELNNLTNLEYLDLSNNRIESLSNQGNETQLRLINLEVLVLSNNLFRNNTFYFPRGLSSLKSLYMRYNSLQGSIDTKELNNLINLKKLDLSNNEIEALQSFKDSDRQLKLTYLEELVLDNNLFKNSVFASLNGLSNLKFLQISNNQLKGSIDMKDLDAFTNLKELNMSYNELNDFVSHKENKGLRKLKVLYLDGVFTNGSIPLLSLVEAFSSVKTFFLRGSYLNKTMTTQELNVSSNVEEIILDDSHLNINILQSIGALTSLKTLSLFSCGLTGSLPNQGWCDLRNLIELDFSRNALEGTLPYCLGNLTSLHVLDISNNQFTGNLTPLANLTSLRFISLSRNHFQISMSFISLANLSDLKVLLSDENKMVIEPSFHTSVPKFQLKVISLSKCTTYQGLNLKPPKFLYYQYDLRYVDISYNSFSGTWPFWLLENNTKLEDLLLNGNSFTGPFSLPSILNLNVSSIDTSNNKLQGQIPKNICSTFPHLERLLLSENAFEGNIPPCLSDMSGLSVLDLSNNQLSGRVPEELIMRSSLLILRLSNNNLSGKVVPTIFKSNRLSELYLDGNNFVGEIPDIDISAVDFPYSLQDIDLSNNNLYGMLPRWIGNVSYLRRLALSNNRFEGSIPLELCNLYELEFLELSQNNLSGSIPSCFNPPYIKHVHLNRNRLSGPLTLAFYKSPSLVTLDLGGNNLTGSIPEWIETLSALSVLLLKANHLHGIIPIQLCKLYSLSIIDLSQNMFSGSIPSCLGNLTLATTNEKSLISNNGYVAYPKEYVSTYIGMTILEYSIPRDYPLSYMKEWVEFTTKSGFYSYRGNILEKMTGIDLSCNKLSRQIPLELGNLSEIHSLNLSHNNLTGVIPSTFSKLKQIESLDLSYNNLNGNIPNQLIELNSLEVFNVAYNNLSGSIPKPKAQFGTFDESSYKGNPFLCGPILHKSCFKTDSPSMISTASDDEGEDSLLDTNVFCVNFLISYVAVFWGIFVVLYINPYWRQAWFSFVEDCITTCRYSIMGKCLELYTFKQRT